MTNNRFNDLLLPTSYVKSLFLFSIRVGYLQDHISARHLNLYKYQALILIEIFFFLLFLPSSLSSDYFTIAT